MLFVFLDGLVSGSRTGTFLFLGAGGPFDVGGLFSGCRIGADSLISARALMLVRMLNRLGDSAVVRRIFIVSLVGTRQGAGVKRCPSVLPSGAPRITPSIAGRRARNGRRWTGSLAVRQWFAGVRIGLELQIGDEDSGLIEILFQHKSDSLFFEKLLVVFDFVRETPVNLLDGKTRGMRRFG